MAIIEQEEEEYIKEYYPSSRKEAKELGYKYYYTGKPCKRGHYDVRKISDRKCYSCERQYYEENKEYIKEQSKEYYEGNKEYILERNKQYHWENREHKLEQMKQYHEENREYFNEWTIQHYEENKEYYKELSREYRQNNPEKVREINANYRAKKRQAFPEWSDVKLLELIYQNRPEGYEVDHIIPLRNGLVCGLHVPENMQYLTKSENDNKSNKFDPDDPDYYLYEDRYCLDLIGDYI